MFVEIDEYIADVPGAKAEIKCSFGETGEPPVTQLYFPSDVSPQDISKAIKHSAFFLEEDMPWSMPVDERKRILELYEEASAGVPGLK